MKYYADEFKPIPFFREYEINHLGKIIRICTCKTLKPFKGRKEVLYVSLMMPIDARTKYRKAATKPIHRLLAETYIPNPHNYKRVKFKSGKRLNVNNLRWVK
jgi:hypothetical protein